MPRTMKYTVCRIILVMLLPVFAAQGRQATVTESMQTFRTYPFGDPDPVARMTNIYPYFRFEGYSITPVERAWKVVTLENPYIKVLIAPEIGGKILGAFEKSTGKAFIYFNKVVKFREIAMRGPWTSGGIEFNFGDIGHTPATATPVDYVTRTNEDGSVSCIVGAIDLPSRTEWRVDIRLPKDKAYFETESNWYNPTDMSTSLYHWMNAAADASSDLQFLYPGTGYIDHGGGAYSWPVDASGRRISSYANNDFGSSKSYHVLGTYTDTYAAYYANADFGVVHWSPYTDKPGKKIWIWSLARDGEIWKDLLTDPSLGNGQYVEIQSGLLFNQAGSGSSRTPFKHESFAPRSEENFIEAWFPFQKTGGMVAANLSGTLNVRRTASNLKIAFCPLGKTDEPVTVMFRGKEIYRRHVTLEPLQAFSDSVRVSGEGDIEVQVGDLLTYSSKDEELRRLHRPLVANKEFDWNSVAGLATDGAERARQRDYSGALEQYIACLSKDPVYSPALVGAAEVCLRRMEYKRGLDYARRALANDAYDPDANYVYAVISRKLGNLYDALDGFGVAARSMKYRAAANAAMAEVSFLLKQWPAAEAYAFRALDYDRFNMSASQLLPVLYRSRGNMANAAGAIAHLRAIDPLNTLAAFESALIDTSALKRTSFAKSLRGELPQESYLELASYYFSLHRYGDALALLEQAPTHPLVSYWLAYLSFLEDKPGKIDTYLKDALELSPMLVFPFRSETAEVLRWAEQRKPHWKTKYYLALIAWNQGRLSDAEKEFAGCGDEPDFAPFYLSRGNFMKTAKPEAVFRDYERALRLDPDAWRAYRALGEYYNAHLEYTKTLDVARKAAARFPASYVVLFDMARSLVLNRQYPAALAILDTLTVLPFEGAGYAREVYNQACVLSAAEAMRGGKFDEAMIFLKQARQWPEHLGVGKPYEVDERFEEYLEAVCLKKSGRTKEANALFERVASYGKDLPGFTGVRSLFSPLAEQELGREADARNHAEAWGKAGASTAARWCAAILSGKRGEAGSLAQELRGRSTESLLGRPGIDQELALAIEVSALYGISVK